jgi:hypothetical protein
MERCGEIEGMPAKKRSFVQVSKCRAKKAWVRLKGKFLPTKKGRIIWWVKRRIVAK